VACDLGPRTAQSLTCSLPTSTHQLGLSGRLRVTFEPLVNEWPCFAAITLSFVEKPQLEFNLETLKVNVMNLPGRALLLLL